MQSSLINPKPHFAYSQKESVITQVTKGALISSLKMYQKRLAAGLCPDPLGELTAHPKPAAKFKGSGSREKRTGRGTGKDRRDGNRGTEEEGRD